MSNIYENNLESLLDGSSYFEDEDDDLDFQPKQKQEEGKIEPIEDSPQVEKYQEVELEENIKVPDISASHNLFSGIEDFEEEQEDEEILEYDNNVLDSVSNVPDLSEIQEEKVAEVKQESQKRNVELDEDHIAFKVLDYVCKRTIEKLKENYNSQIYTKEYMCKLMEDYVNGKTDSSNPLFKQLMLECIENADNDEYLGDLTKDVLEYISEN